MARGRCCPRASHRPGNLPTTRATPAGRCWEVRGDRHRRLPGSPNRQVAPVRAPDERSGCHPVTPRAPGPRRSGCVPVSSEQMLARADRLGGRLPLACLAITASDAGAAHLFSAAGTIRLVLGTIRVRHASKNGNGRRYASGAIVRLSGSATTQPGRDHSTRRPARIISQPRGTSTALPADLTRSCIVVASEI